MTLAELRAMVMRLRFSPWILAVVAVLAWPAEDTMAARRTQARPTAAPPEISRDTRLLVIAPHPDDEVLAAGGLMQQVHDAGGAVRVVYLTDGDGFPEGVRLEERDRTLTSGDFRDYGRRRQREARGALAALGLDPSDAKFLSFPDTGLCKLIRVYWSERRTAYRSPYTRLTRPPAAERLDPDTKFRGEDLTQELAAIVGQFRPTLVLVPRKEDQHPDHRAAWYFLVDALGDVRRVHSDFTTDVLTYIVHDNGWPFSDDGPALPPPPGVGSGVSGWIRVPLTPAEVRAKRSALQKYRTQVHAMAWFLDGFVRSNEIFSRPTPASTNVVLPLKHSACW